MSGVERFQTWHESHVGLDNGSGHLQESPEIGKLNHNFITEQNIFFSELNTQKMTMNNEAQQVVSPSLVALSSSVLFTLCLCVLKEKESWWGLGGSGLGGLLGCRAAWVGERV